MKLVKAQPDGFARTSRNQVRLELARDLVQDYKPDSLSQTPYERSAGMATPLLHSLLRTYQEVVELEWALLKSSQRVVFSFLGRKVRPTLSHLAYSNNRLTRVFCKVIAAALMYGCVFGQPEKLPNTLYALIRLPDTLIQGYNCGWDSVVSNPFTCK